MLVAMFVYQHGFGSIEDQIENDLNEFLEKLYESDISYEIKYVSTGKGMIVVVEYEEMK